MRKTTAHHNQVTLKSSDKGETTTDSQGGKRPYIKWNRDKNYGKIFIKSYEIKDIKYLSSG